MHLYAKHWLKNLMQKTYKKTRPTYQSWICSLHEMRKEKITKCLEHPFLINFFPLHWIKWHNSLILKQTNLFDLYVSSTPWELHTMKRFIILKMNYPLWWKFVNLFFKCFFNYLCLITLYLKLFRVTDKPNARLNFEIIFEHFSNRNL